MPRILNESPGHCALTVSPQPLALDEMIYENTNQTPKKRGKNDEEIMESKEERYEERIHAQKEGDTKQTNTKCILLKLLPYERGIPFICLRTLTIHWSLGV